MPITSTQLRWFIRLNWFYHMVVPLAQTPPAIIIIWSAHLHADYKHHECFIHYWYGIVVRLHIHYKFFSFLHDKKITANDDDDDNKSAEKWYKNRVSSLNQDHNIFATTTTFIYYILISLLLYVVKMIFNIFYHISQGIWKNSNTTSEIRKIDTLARMFSRTSQWESGKVISNI